MNTIRANDMDGSFFLNLMLSVLVFKKQRNVKRENKD